MNRFFASDNCSGVHPAIMEAILKANTHHMEAYGADPITKAAKEKLRALFGGEPYFVLTGTAANVLGLKAVTASYEAVICPDSAHIVTSECGAVENHTGCQLYTASCPQGKMTPEIAAQFLEFRGGVHHAQPRVISISQSTESGTLYTVDEVKALAAFAHKHDMYLQMDGARLSNAVAALGCSFREMTEGAGVDILSFGGTKNGMMFGEALLFFGKLKNVPFPYIQKQGMQLVSKMRFLSAQFLAFFENDLWLKNASHSNKLAKLLEIELKAIPGAVIMHPVEANALFVQLPRNVLDAIQRESFFWMWSEKESVGRFMTTWDTTEEDVRQFAAIVKKHCS